MADRIDYLQISDELIRDVLPVIMPSSIMQTITDVNIGEKERAQYRSHIDHLLEEAVTAYESGAGIPAVEQLLSQQEPEILQAYADRVWNLGRANSALKNEPEVFEPPVDDRAGLKRLLLRIWLELPLE